MICPMPQSDTDQVATQSLLPRVGVSRCLLGEDVRVNGGHCRNKWILNVLRNHADLIGVCPEVEFGLPTPRPAMRLVLGPAADGADQVRLVESKSGRDWTSGMARYAESRVSDLAASDLDGFILKKDSPTCGVFRVKVYDQNGSPSSRGRGLFADALIGRFPNLPVEEEGRLNDPALRESFLVRIHARRRWRRFLDEDGSSSGFGAFHARHKMLLLAADPAGYRHLGRLVAGHAHGYRTEQARRDAYEVGLMSSLSRTVSRGRHVNVLQHLLGFCKTELSAEEKRELADTLSLYTEGVLPRAAPVTLVRYLLLRHDAAPWACEQFYLKPFPAQLASAKEA